MDVIVSISTPAAREAKNFTKTTPIVFIAADPVKTGLVSNLGRPGGNLTGLSLTLGDEFAGKWLELLVDTIPQLSRVAILWNPSNPSNASFLKAVQSSSQSFRTTLLLHGVADASQFDSAFRAMADARAQALIVFVDPITVRHRARIVELATKGRLPAIYGFREFADAGGLMAYGPNVAGACRRAAVYVDKVLKGAKPGDLPVEQVTQFEFLINLKTVKALGLTVPQSVLVRADEIIQ
jgi:putative tryptophan/tyrosine transport system substrate-binding protein